MVINKATMMEKQADGTFRNVGEIVPNIDQRVRDLESSKSSTEESLASINSSIKSLATVATSGNYSDLEGTPSLSAVATSGNYSDLEGTPSLSAVATSGNYEDLSGRPSLATVATTGSYNDLTDKPSIPSSVNYTVSQKGARTTAGIWTITGLTVNKPLFIIGKCSRCTVVLKSGTITNFNSNDGSFTLGFGDDGGTNVIVVIPVGSTVVLSVMIYSNGGFHDLYAYQ